MDKNKNKINVFGKSYVTFYPDLKNINLDYPTSLRVRNYNTANYKIYFDSFSTSENMSFYEVIKFNSSSIISKDACHLYDINNENKSTSEYSIIYQFNSTNRRLEQYIPKNSLDINNDYISILGKLNDSYYFYYNPIKVEFINDDSNNNVLAIVLGITIPIFVIALAIIAFICYKKRKKSDNNLLNENKTEELMPIQN